MGFRLGDGLRSSASEAIDGRSEYQVPHNAAPDISRCHAKREEQTTETDEQTQRIAKQDEKARRRHTEKRRITQSKADQKDKARQHRQKNKPYPQPKQKTKNYTYQKETTRVLHPASRLTPKNGGIPPFWWSDKTESRVSGRYRPA